MAGVFRYGLCRVFATSNKSITSPKVTTEVKFFRCITGKSLRIVDPNVKKPAPYPYKDKPYLMHNRLFDKTTARFDENTKLIVVEGPIAAGKSAFAKELANDLGMLYMPEANLDMVYINDYGFDMRSLDPFIPENVRTFDVKDFCKNPKHRSAASFQIIQYSLRFDQYIDALAHLMSTGQGVVLDRCAFSDFVFLEAMFNEGYISRGARSVYYDVKQNTISELMRPHLIIYLDIPVNVVQQRVKARKIPYEVNSPVFSTSYLTSMENAYKQNYLKNISKYSELLVYDWSQGGDVEVVVEDIERINFDDYDKDDMKMSDWRFDEEEEWAMRRHYYSDKKDEIMNYFNVPRYDVPELVNSAEDLKKLRDVIAEKAKGVKYEYGYNADAGDENLVFKSGLKNRFTLPLRERIIPQS